MEVFEVGPENGAWCPFLGELDLCRPGPDYRPTELKESSSLGSHRLPFFLPSNSSRRLRKWARNWASSPPSSGTRS